MEKFITAVIDAGSSGTRLFLFDVQPGAYPIVKKIAEVEHSTMPNGEREDGINNFVHPLAPNLEAQVVPMIVWPLLNSIRPQLYSLGVEPSQVSVHLFATAGMRYSAKMFGVQAIEHFYDRIRHGINQAGFALGEVRTIDGQREEGVWTWINLNDLERDVFRTDASPLGIVEVGGSSAQLSFPVDTDYPHKESVQIVTINGRTFNLYCKSYMGLGQDDARKAMRIKLGEASACCFPKGFRAENDFGDVLDGVGQYRLSEDGRYHFSDCHAIYEQIIKDVVMNDPMPSVDEIKIDFVGTDAIFHATRYWMVEHNPIQLAAMLIDQSLSLDMFPGIESNEFIQAQAANATYVHALLFGEQGLFKNRHQQLLSALPGKSENNGTHLTWTRGYLLQKFAFAKPDLNCPQPVA